MQLKIINNVINKEDASVLIEYVSNNLNDKKRFTTSTYYKDMAETSVPDVHELYLHEEIFPMLKKYTNIFINECKIFFPNSEDAKLYAFKLSRLGKLNILDPHVDRIEGTPIDFSGVLYLSDESEGGDLYFPEFDFTYKPNFGDLVLFSPDYVHEVKEITNGLRFTMPLWATLEQKQAIFIP
jgi:hypothetical protein